jgi:hypothetical protein
MMRLTRLSFVLYLYAASIIFALDRCLVVGIGRWSF